jgi:integrase
VTTDETETTPATAPEPAPKRPRHSERIHRPRKRKRRKVPAKGFSEAFIRNDMEWPRPGDRAPQLKYLHRLRTGLSLQFVAGAGGVGTWRAVLYAEGKPYTVKLGRWPGMDAPTAEQHAQHRFLYPDEYRAPVSVTTVNDVVDAFEHGYVAAKKLISEDEVKRCFKKYVRPVIGEHPAHTLDRDQINRMLDAIAINNGPTTADKVLALLSKAFKWYAAKKDSTFTTPIVPGMGGRSNGEERTRKLTDDELRVLWKAEGLSERAELFRDFCVFSILTGQRKSKTQGIRFKDIGTVEGIDNVWTVGHRGRQKGNGEFLPLGPLAMAIVAKRRAAAGDAFDENDLIFPLPENSGSLDRDYKKLLDAAIGNLGDDPWKLHDCRRTSKSMMSATGVLPWVSERVLGHEQGELVKIYDQHTWMVEKGKALVAIEQLFKQIVGLVPPALKVVA